MSQTRAWTWRHAIIKSSLPATTRHVLLTISCFMNELGDGCYPTQKQIAEATGLSDRAVRTQLEIAETEGWIRRSEHGFKGQKWRNHEYSAVWPNTQDIDLAAEPASARSDEAAERASGKVRNVVPKGAERRSDYQSIHQSIHQSTSGAQARGGGDFDILWSSWPENSRPDNRDAVQAIFCKLANQDQRRAIDMAATYHRFCSLRKQRALMVPYLRQRRYDELYAAPPMDEDGDFVITPDRPEWGEWLTAIRRDHGEEAVKSSVRTQKIVRKTRWPIQLQPSEHAA